MTTMGKSGGERHPHPDDCRPVESTSYTASVWLYIQPVYVWLKIQFNEACPIQGYDSYHYL